MTTPNDVDIVELRLEAENLALGEVTDTIDGLSDLGTEARKTEKELEKLEIQKDTIQSYVQIQESVKALRKEFDLAEIAYDKMAKAVKANKNATDEEVLTLKNAKRELNDMGVALRLQETEYRKISKSIKEFGIDTKNLDTTQQQLEDQIKQTSATSARLNQEYIQSATAIRQRIIAEKEALAVARQLELAENDRQAQLSQTVAEQQKAADAARRADDAEQTRINQLKKTADQIAQYEVSLRKMAKAVDDGRLSTTGYIREEERLRTVLGLTQAQVKTTLAVLKAETDERKKAQKAIQDQLAEQRKLADEQKKADDAAKKTADAERAAAIELQRVEQAVKEYEIALDRLNREKQEGNVSTGQYIREEERLRRSLNLTESQVTTTRRAIEADAKSRIAAVKNTDLLTQATRRLAQVYTVLLAAQKATQAVSQSVTEYGDLEAAITKVEKTTGSARLQVEGLADILSDMAENITPTATTELLRYAEVAGQLGTKSTADLLNLVAAADALENSTNLAGDEAVELLARVLTMTGEGIPAIQNLASSVVALGNDFAATEQDIVFMTKEIVSGTREIDLSSKAAAAFAATLAELGQPAERSRTAIQRLSGVIKEAVVKGGEDLERLSLVTKLTGDQIVESFGTEPEKILIAFLDGLKDINDSGGQMSTVLKQVGIDGTEALGVLTTLAGRTDRLKIALQLSNEQFVAGNAHMKEAAKAYANQESALGRLQNQFGGLKKAIGEAYSDETEAAIQAVSDVIKDTEGNVIGLMEFLPEMVTGLTEVVSILDEFLSTFGESGQLVNDTINVLKSGVNTITIAIRGLVLGFQGIVVASAEVYNAITPLADLKINTESIERLRTAMRNTADGIKVDIADITDASNRIAGESSIAFEGLIDAADKYKLALGNLSAEQRASINNIITKNKYSADEEKTYRELTAALVRANRELEIEAELQKNAKVIKEQNTQANQDQIASMDGIASAQIGINITLAEYLEKSNAVEASIDQIKQKRKDGILTDEQARAEIDALSATLDQYTIVAETHNESIKRNTKTTQENLAARKDLYEQYQQGKITEQELITSLNQLSDKFALANISLNSYAATNEATTLAQAKFADQILQTQKKIDDYNATLRSGNLIEADSLRIKAALVVEEQKLIRLRTEQAQLIEIENATYGQLVILQRQYQRELQVLNREFQAGLLSKAQYEERTRSLTDALNEINGVIGENTRATAENTAVTEQNTQAQSERTEAIQQATTAASLQAAANNELNKSYDFSNQSVEQLNARYAELESRVQQNITVNNVWWRQLAQTWNEVYNQEQAVIAATLAMREMTAEVESGSLSLSELSKISRAADISLTALSQQQMQPLLQAIAKAKQDLLGLTQTVDDALLNVQDRLDRALGDETSIIKRKFEKEMNDYLALMEKARLSGDTALVSRVEEAIRKLKQAQDLEYKTQFGQTNTTTTTTSGPQQPNVPTTPSPTSGSGVQPTAVLQLQISGQTYNVQTDSSTLDRLISDVSRASKLGG